MDVSYLNCFASCIFAFSSLSIAFIVWFLLKGDADVTLLFCEKFGKRQNFSGKVVWITGASSGIGECLAYDLARCGAKLVISGVNVEKLEQVKKNCLDYCVSEADVLMLPFLIEDFSIHEECVKKVIEHFGHIDVLVNNAGVSQRAKFEDIQIDVDQKLFSINVFGTINLTRKVLPHLLERNESQIVVTSSLAGKMGAPFSCSYTGSKHALHGYFEGLRSETIQKGVSVCIVCPGPVFSRITSRCVTGKLGELYDEQQSTMNNKMKTERCSRLMVVAMANKLDECWICLQPILLLYYLTQYFPTIFRRILLKKFYSPEKARKLRRGES